MPIKYTYDKDNKIINTDAYGDIHVTEIVEYLEQVLNDDDIVFGSVELFSVENATDMDMRYDNIRVFKELWVKYKQKIGNMAVIIAPTEKTYGLYRMLASLLATSDPDAVEGFKVTKSRDEALAYINSLG